MLFITSPSWSHRNRYVYESSRLCFELERTKDGLEEAQNFLSDNKHFTFQSAILAFCSSPLLSYTSSSLCLAFLKERLTPSNYSIQTSGQSSSYIQKKIRQKIAFLCTLGMVNTCDTTFKNESSKIRFIQRLNFTYGPHEAGQKQSNYNTKCKVDKAENLCH